MSTTEFQIDTLAIVGVGLIGGSIAAAVRQRRLARRIIGFGRNHERLEQARVCGLIDEVATQPEALAAARLIVVCTPVDRLGKDIGMLLNVTSPSTLITDVGSVKSPVVQQASEMSGQIDRFVPAHPIAGSHLQGFEHAHAELCRDRLCILTPLFRNRPEDVEFVRSFWKGIGMRVSDLSVEEHDRALALTSHLPHLAASAVAFLVDEHLLDYAATGYRDTTRVAAGDPELWTAIFSENSGPLADATSQLIHTLQEFLTALSSGDRSRIQAFLELGQQRRRGFHDCEQGAGEST